MSVAKSVDQLMTMAASTPIFERALLEAFSEMELRASEAIDQNLQASSMAIRASELKIHADFEKARHGDLKLMAEQILRPVGLAHEEKLIEQCKQLAHSFVFSFFTNPILCEAPEDQFLHLQAIIAIKQAPLQLYKPYAKLTQNQDRKKRMRNILGQESPFAQLNHLFRHQLSEQEILLTADLDRIEHSMLESMADAIRLLFTRFNQADEAAHSIEEYISSQPQLSTAWTNALAESEQTAAITMQRIFVNSALPLPTGMGEHINDMIRHSQQLSYAALMGQQHLEEDSRYHQLQAQLKTGFDQYLQSVFECAEELSKGEAARTYTLAAIALEKRKAKHCRRLRKELQHIGVTHVISSILESETSHLNHSLQLLRSQAGPKGDQHLEALQEKIMNFEMQAFAKLCQGMLMQMGVDQQHSATLQARINLDEIH